MRRKGLKVLSLNELQETYSDWQRNDELSQRAVLSGLAEGQGRRFLVGSTSNRSFSAAQVKEFTAADPLCGRLAGN